MNKEFLCNAAQQIRYSEENLLKCLANLAE